MVDAYKLCDANSIPLAPWLRCGRCFLQRRQFLTGEYHHKPSDVHYQSENRTIIDLQIEIVDHTPETLHFIFEKRPMIDFQIGNPEYRSGYAKWNGNLIRTENNPPPCRRAGPAGCPTTAMAGTFFTSTDIHTHSCYPNDFTDPDCHLLGEKRKREEQFCYKRKTDAHPIIFDDDRSRSPMLRRGPSLFSLLGFYCLA